MTFVRPVRQLSPQLVEMLQQFAPTTELEAHSLRAFGHNFDPATLASVAVMDASEMDCTTFGVRLQFMHASGKALEIVVKNRVKNRVRVDLNISRVSKKSLYHPHLAQREADWLKRVSGPFVARLLAVNGSTLFTSYEGEPVNIYNLPEDWRVQAEAILTHLRAAACCHNDINAANMVVSSGRLKLIDFAWATEIGEPIPEDWPRDLGFSHFIAPHQFDDRKAMFEALEAVEDASLAALTPRATAVPPRT